MRHPALPRRRRHLPTPLVAPRAQGATAQPGHNLGIKPEAAEHRLDQTTAFFPDAQVTDYQDLVPAMTNHPKDRHVLTAAIAGHAEAPVTENLHDFPATAAEPHDILLLDQDEPLLSQLEQYPRAVRDAQRRQASRHRREPRTAEDLLTVLSRPGRGSQPHRAAHGRTPDQPDPGAPRSCP